MNVYGSCGSLFIAASLFITNIFFIFLSLFGMEYNGKETEGPIFIITVLGINCIAILFILNYERKYHLYAQGKIWPYWIPFIYFSFYALELFMGMVDSGSRAEDVMRDFIAVSLVGIWGGTFCYRCCKFKEIVEYIELLLFVSTIALLLALPTMFLKSIGVTIGGAGDHQIVSYIAAVSLGFTICRLRFKPNFGLLFFNSPFYRYISPFVALIQAFICLVGGGRGGFVLLIVIMTTIILYSIKDILKLIIIGLVIIILIIFLFNVISPTLEDTNIMRAFSIFAKSGEDVDSIRSSIYKITTNYIYDAPLFGHGIFFQYNWCQKILTQPYCHNLFLEILLQGGIMYLIIWLIVFLRFFIKVHYLIKIDPVYSFLIPLVAYSFVMLMFSGTYLLTPLFWFVIIFVLGTKNIKTYKR